MQINKVFSVVLSGRTSSLSVRCYFTGAGPPRRGRR
jgi:hypothetical protein